MAKTFTPAIIILLFAILTGLNSLARQDGIDIYRTPSGVSYRVEVVAEGLCMPWSICFLPNGRILVSERAGSLRLIENGKLRPEPIAVPDEISPFGEAGLMGIAIDPKFADNHFVYLCYSYSPAKDKYLTRVSRFKEQNNQLSDRKIVFDGIPVDKIHDGGRIRFGPDGKLYITTGDIGKKELAQDLKSLAGKILRINSDGTIPADNPFKDSPIYSYGNRNPQGIDWHPITGKLFATEHGPSEFDAPHGGDEVNIIEPGKNYGWPVIHHRMRKEGMITPLLEYTPAIAPSGASFYRGNAFPEFRNNYFFANLAGKHIRRVIFDSKEPHKVVGEERLADGKFGRLRDVVEGPDGALYFSSNSNWGDEEKRQNKIFRIVPAKR